MTNKKIILGMLKAEEGSARYFWDRDEQNKEKIEKQIKYRWDK